MSNTILHRPPINSTFGDDTARARRSDPTTAHEAADTNDVSRSIGLVLRILTQCGMLADHEIEAWASGYDLSFTGQRLRTARAALVSKGLVEASGIYRQTRNNRRAIVWQVTS